MDIPESYKKILLDEMEFIRKKIIEEPDISDKLYYYSAAYGMTRRIVNLKFDPQLQFMDFILNVTYQIMHSRFNTIRNGDLTVPLDANFFDDLVYCIEQLEEKIQKNEDTYLILQKIYNLTSLLDGNGYYLSKKGVQVFTR